VITGTVDACALKRLESSWHFASPRMRGQGQCYSGHGEGRSGKSWNGELREDEACFSFPCWEGKRDGMAPAAGKQSFPPAAAAPTQQPLRHSAWFPDGFDNVLVEKFLKKLGCIGKSSGGTIG